MPTFRSPGCGCWWLVPDEALASETLFKRWYSEHHWPHCPRNPQRRPLPLMRIRQKTTAVRDVVIFAPDVSNLAGVEVIPERPDDGVWRVLNVRTHSWPVVRVGELLDITDLTDVQVLPREWESTFERVPDAE